MAVPSSPSFAQWTIWRLSEGCSLCVTRAQPSTPSAARHDRSTTTQTCIVMAYLVMAYIVMAYIVMAFVVMAYIVMARSIHDNPDPQ